VSAGTLLGPLRSLVAAQLQVEWNRLRREAGAGGRLASVGIAAMVALALSVPAAFLARLGWGLGQELRAGADAGVLRSWQLLQAGLSVGFGLLAGWRFRPAFSAAALARFPVRGRDLLIAELPASLLEVFPLLAAVGLGASHLGMAAAWPVMAPLILLAGALGVVTMLAAAALSAAAWRALFQRAWAPLLPVVAGLALWQAGWENVREGLRVAGRVGVESLPTSRGLAALLDLRAGELADAARGFAITVLSAAAVFALAAWVHARSVMRSGNPEARPRRRPRGGPTSLGALFQAQVLATAGGRQLLFMPVLLTAPLAILVVSVRSAVERGEVMPEPLVRLAGAAQGLPWPWLVFVFVALDAELWLNQFGFDGGGLRLLLQLPVSAERLLLGRLAGLARLAAVQTLLGCLPLLAVRLPSPAEVVAGLGMGAFAVIAAGGAGQLFSLRFPRRIEARGSTSLPLRFSWVPLAVLLPLVAWLAAAQALAAPLGSAAVAAAPVALALLAGLGYRWALPLLARQLGLQRERLAAL
jgi:hypothetical protein